MMFSIDYDFLRRAAEIKAVVVNCTLKLYFRLYPCIKLPKVWFLSAAAPNLVLVLPAFMVESYLFQKESIVSSSLTKRPPYFGNCMAMH